MLDMGITNHCHGLGIGTLLISVIIKWAKQNQLLTIIWLEIYNSNVSGKALYNKMGFLECGRIKDFFKENGQLIDNIRMDYHLCKSF